MDRRCVGLAALAALLGLSGCADMTSLSETAFVPAVPPAPSPAPVALDPAALAAAPILILSLEGAPEGPRQDFDAALRRELAARGVATADAKGARYFLRGWLAARPGAEQAEFSYVFDIYDRSRARVARLDAGFAVKGTGDAWSLMSAETLNGVAAQSAGDIAGFLSRAAAPAATPVLSYAPDQPL